MPRDDLPKSVYMPAISAEIWNMKYRLRGPSDHGHLGEPIDQTVEDTWRRVARALSQAEKPEYCELWEERFYDAMEDFKFVPGGRIIAGAGSAREVTLQSCYVMGTIPDSIVGIFDMLGKSAVTMQQGGGIGMDFSTLRPRGSAVKGVGADASGPLTFMDCWDSMCRTIESAGYRRGAMMATMRCDHPDIEAFIEAKADRTRLRMFNLSVLVTDAFMQAVKDDAPWALIFNGKVEKYLPARDLWGKIMRSTYDYAEPGVIFIDRVNRLNNLYYCETISATNPCGEEPLPPYGNCLLGWLNLARFVHQPFTADAYFDLDELREIVPVAIRALDNVIDISRYPIEEQRAEAFAKRRLGLGIGGLADALIMMGQVYGSEEAVATTNYWMGVIQELAYEASAFLSAEKGAFPLFDREKYLAGEHVKDFAEGTLALIREHGMRNSHVMAVAPTGTGSQFAGYVSGGCEPVFAFTHKRKLIMPGGERKERDVEDYAYALYRRMDEPNGPAAGLDYFVDAQTLSPEAHLCMLAAVQRHCDTGVSKTINLPKDISFEDFKDVYQRAYDYGCKSCATYRPNEVTGSVLSVASPSVDAVALSPSAVISRDRPEILQGETVKIRWGSLPYPMFLTMNDEVLADGTKLPFEVFINSKSVDYAEWVTALTRLISAVMRKGGDLSFLPDELMAVWSARDGQFVPEDQQFVPSVIAKIGMEIKEHFIRIGYMEPGDVAAVSDEELKLTGVHYAELGIGRECPQCAALRLYRSEGCDKCFGCGWSNCG